MVDLAPKCSVMAYNPTTGTGNNKRQNISSRAQRPIGLPDFVMDVSGANVFSDANKIPDASVRRTTWRPDPAHVVNVTAQSQQPADQASTVQCDFENDGCSFSGSPSRYYNSTCEPTACRVGGSAFSDRCRSCTTNDGVGSLPLRGSSSAVLSLGEFAREAWMERAVPQGISSISFDHGHTWGMRNCPSDNCTNLYAALQVLLDGQEVGNYIPEYQRDTSISSSSYVSHYVAPWKHESISIDPSRSHNLRFKIAVYDTGNPRDDQAVIDNIVFSGTPPPSSTTRQYSVRINQLKGNGGWVATESLPVLNTARPRLILPMNAQVGIKGNIGPAGAPVTEIWSMVYGLGAHSPMTPAQFASGISLNNGAQKLFTVEAGEAFSGGANPNIYALDILADTSDPVDNVFYNGQSPNLATLGNLVLPWYDAVLPYSYQDDTAMKGMKIVSGTTEIFSTNFGTNMYTTYPSIPSIAGKIVLSQAQIGRMPVTTRRAGFSSVSERIFQVQGFDIAGRSVSSRNGNAVIFDIPATAKIVADKYDLNTGQSATVRWEGVSGIASPLKIKFKAWTIPDGGGAPVNHDSWITAAGSNSATFTPLEPGVHEVEALLVTADGRSYLKKATPNVVWFDVPSIPVRSPIAMGVGNDKVFICPAELPCGVEEDNVVSYDILKRPDGSNAAFSRVGTVDKAVFNADCYADTAAIPNTAYQYVLQANLTGGKKSDKSPPDKA
ncbi:MAG: hypothetical protein Q7T11_03510, partial [Deltaproteobacteria bacterium]|nr:hypothetical protein [Deltaproteobacteria bacterium]